jgi:hypothetical protein
MNPMESCEKDAMRGTGSYHSTEGECILIDRQEAGCRSSSCDKDDEQHEPLQRGARRDRRESGRRLW